MQSGFGASTPSRPPIDPKITMPAASRAPHDDCACVRACVPPEKQLCAARQRGDAERRAQTKQRSLLAGEGSRNRRCGLTRARRALKARQARQPRWAVSAVRAPRGTVDWLWERCARVYRVCARLIESALARARGGGNALLPRSLALLFVLLLLLLHLCAGVGCVIGPPRKQAAPSISCDVCVWRSRHRHAPRTG